MPHFHALSNDELQALEPFLKKVNERCEEIIERWYQLYVRQLGEGRALAANEFCSIMSPLFRHGATALLNRDFQEFERLAKALGRRLAERGVSFLKSFCLSIFARRA